MLSRKEIKNKLLAGNYEELRKSHQEQEQNTECVNEPSEIGKSTLLHEIVQKRKSTNYDKVEAIKCLFDIGIDPSKVEGNGDTALHTAIYETVDEEVLEALIYSKHVNDFHKENQPCFCGFKALEIDNNRKQKPREVGNIIPSLLQILNTAGEYLALST